MRSSFILSTVVAISLAPSLAFAATILLIAQPQTIGVGDSVQITLRVESVIPLNTFAGILVYPLDLFSAESVSDGGSIASVWLTHPEAKDGGVSFAGFTPGGFSGEGTLFRVVLKAKRAGTAQISIVTPEFLRNDGAGTQEQVSAPPLLISIGEKLQSSFVEPLDANPPEPFLPSLVDAAHSPNGAAYLVFAAVDKDSGIDHYEVSEGDTKSWTRTTSPYVLHDQTLASDIFVKAVDRAGNERIAEFPHTSTSREYEALLLGGMLAVLIILWVIYKRYFRKIS